MAHVYQVDTNRGSVPVAVNEHHEHISKAEFERILLAAVAHALGVAVNVAGGIILHRYTYKGHR